MNVLSHSLIQMGGKKNPLEKVSQQLWDRNGQNDLKEKRRKENLSRKHFITVSVF